MSVRANSFVVVLICFVLSGFAALVYETVWLRQFSLVFGTSDSAVAVVLAGYMAGLALGGALAPAILRRVRSPVRTYAFFELAIAVAAIVWVPGGMWLVHRLKIALFGGRPEPQDAGVVSDVVFDQLTSFAIIMVPTVLMGATLPLLARYVVRDDEHIGKRIGLLYSANTLGAVLGTLIAAFLLLPAFGLRITTWVGAAANLAVFALAAWMVRNHATESSPDRSTSVPAGSAAAAHVAVGRWILPLMLVSGATSFAYEILWTRMLGHVMGGSIFSFATMLAGFLLGIAIGSALATRFARDRDRAARGFVMAQLGTGVFSLAVYHGMQSLPDIANRLGSVGHEALSANLPLAMLVLLPSTICLGTTFPFAVRILAGDSERAAQAAGTVYAWNTVGAISGAMLTGAVLLPWLRYEGMATAAISVNLLLAFVALIPSPRRSLRAVFLLLLAAGALWKFAPETPVAVLRSSPFPALNNAGDLTFYRTGRSSTVVMLNRAGHVQIRTNGLPEAGIPTRGTPPAYASIESWLCPLPVLLRPQVKSMLVVGFGGGNALSYLPATVESVDVFELEPEVIEANRQSAGMRNHDPLTDPRIRVVLNDARNGLAMTSKQYGAIVSQPSHPWTSGASHLYTQEFLQIARGHLKPGGVFVQWMSDEFLDAELFRSLGRTMLNVFDYVRVYRPNQADILLVGSDEPLNVEAEFDSQSDAFQANAALYETLGVQSVEDLLFLLAVDHQGLCTLCEGTGPITDNNNRLALRARGSRRDEGVFTLDELTASVDPICRESERRRLLAGRPASLHYLTRRIIGAGNSGRTDRLLDSISSSDGRALIDEWLLMREARVSNSWEWLDRLPPVDRDNPEAVYGRFLATQLRDPTEAGSDRFEPSPGWPASLRAVITGSRYGAEGRWSELRTLDPQLAQARPTDPWFSSANVMRISWRLRTATASEPEAGREAIDLIDRTLPLEQAISLLGMRASAAYRIGAPDVAVATINEVIARVELVARDAKQNRPGAVAQLQELVRRVRAQNLQALLAAIRNNPNIQDRRLLDLAGEVDYWLARALSEG